MRLWCVFEFIILLFWLLIHGDAWRAHAMHPSRRSVWWLWQNDNDITTGSASLASTSASTRSVETTCSRASLEARRSAWPPERWWSAGCRASSWMRSRRGSTVPRRSSSPRRSETPVISWMWALCPTSADLLASLPSLYFSWHADTLPSRSFLQLLFLFAQVNIIVALLQPSPETFEIYDDLMLMGEGKVGDFITVVVWGDDSQSFSCPFFADPHVLPCNLDPQVMYHGPREDAMPFFTSLGLTCPPRKAVADFLQEVTSKKDQAVSAVGDWDRVQRWLMQCWPCMVHYTIVHYIHRLTLFIFRIIPLGFHQTLALV